MHGLWRHGALGHAVYLGIGGYAVGVLAKEGIAQDLVIGPDPALNDLCEWVQAECQHLDEIGTGLHGDREQNLTAKLGEDGVCIDFGEN